MHSSTKNNFPVVEKNLSSGERLVSVAAGSYLMYRAFKKSSYLNGILASFLLARGSTGYCAAAQFFGKSKVLKNQNVNSKISIIVNKPRHEVYEFWRNLENLPLFMKHLEEVKSLDDKTSIWKASTMGNLPEVMWISEIVEDEKNERIGWRSLEGSDISNVGNVHFTDIGKSVTEVSAVISYQPSYGKAGELVARMLNPAVESMVLEDIKRFKEYMESGTISSS
ncbi:MAG TPA: SRPBCC family protein [Salinimicrobium sp.]|nr:SRPBCC family protein [Salinimicrobium sp.]